MGDQGPTLVLDAGEAVVAARAVERWRAQGQLAQVPVAWLLRAAGLLELGAARCTIEARHLRAEAARRSGATA